MIDYTQKRIEKVEDLPASFRSRAGWAELFELQRPSEPHIHQIEPTNHCPYQCIMCPRSTKMTRELGFMERGEFSGISAYSPQLFRDSLDSTIREEYSLNGPCQKRVLPTIIIVRKDRPIMV